MTDVEVQLEHPHERERTAARDTVNLRLERICAAADNPSSQEAILWSVVALCVAKKKLLLKKRRKREWCKLWLSRRPVRGSYNQIFSELQSENSSDFENYTRMPVIAFHALLTKIKPDIEKEDTHVRESISPGARFEATRRFLAAGGSYASLQHSTRISKQSLGSIIPETCEAIYNVLKEDYLKVLAERPLCPGDDPPGAVRPSSAQEALDGAIIQDGGPRRPCGGTVHCHEGFLC
ncbi:uncharacterized protein LOC123517072 [Portunus trituberculatus]|uniref:uncharacterized protein LOC123517072 n=1 Tax=Portunus trituberculatus TaxID=210409 RepID=UPI001E1CEDF3|nr:uncharacterized protein LOC123517072 [Portunus trituberculatus]